MLKFIPQLAKLCASLYNLKALCEQTSWLTHVANDHVIDLLSCNSILDHFQTRSFYSTVVDRAWFFTSNKIKLPKYYVFSNANCSSPMKTMQDQISRIRQHFFKDSGSKAKKIVLNIEQWKTKERLSEIYQNLLCSFMITQNKGEWPTCLALTSVTEQFSNYSSNQVYFFIWFCFWN